jgi:tRNA G18 (ribose-2'-O)-methylase SpoU
LKEEGYCLVGLEQTSGSECLYGFPFLPRTALVIGHERRGIDQSILDALDHVLEIPVFGLPHSYNVATATAMALYEYCRRFTLEPAGGMD